MTTSPREVREGLVLQGISEEVPYGIELGLWLEDGQTASSPAVVAYDERDWSEATAKILTGTAAIVGSLLTTPIVRDLRLDTTYRVVCTFDVSGAGKRSCFFRVRGER
ncbi:MAG TPA: hypothetical protein PL117_03170 [Accumulibacter sp.]|nr:hypothetical protein [Accumulibacter sp.]